MNLGDKLSQDFMRFGAQVSLTSWIPTLVIEEIDHLLRFVDCDSEHLDLAFYPSAFEQALKALEQLDELLLVTSHQTCNPEGSRLPYRYMSYISARN